MNELEIRALAEERFEAWWKFSHTEHRPEKSVARAAYFAADAERTAAVAEATKAGYENGYVTAIETAAQVVDLEAEVGTTNRDNNIVESAAWLKARTCAARIRSLSPHIDLVHTDHPLRHYDRTCPACTKRTAQRCVEICNERGTWWEVRKIRDAIAKEFGL